jgi:hypothetical protein
MIAAIGWMLAGAYLTGLLAVLFACTSEPWPDRAGIALAWPAAVALIVWRG